MTASTSSESQGVNSETEAVLVHLIEKERAVSAERKRLHRLIDEHVVA